MIAVETHYCHDSCIVVSKMAFNNANVIAFFGIYIYKKPIIFC